MHLAHTPRIAVPTLPSSLVIDSKKPRVIEIAVTELVDKVFPLLS